MLNKNKIKLIISIVLGLVSTFVLLIVIVEHFYYFCYPSMRAWDFILACIIYAFVILFLVLWNMKSRSGYTYLILLAPVACILVIIAVEVYDDRVRNTPEVYEGFNLEIYRPFRANNLLAELDEVSEFKINDNVPKLDGATAFYPLYAAFAQAVYPTGEYLSYDLLRSAVLCTRTPNAYRSLLQGKVDIIFCLEPSQAQLQQFHENNMNIKFVPIGKEAFVFFVNSKNAVSNLSVDDIQGIYTGRIKNWRFLNGMNRNILAYQRPEGSGSQTILRKIMGDIPVIEPRKENVMQEMQGIINQVATYRNFYNAVGYSFLMYATEMVQDNQIKLLSINGIYPSVETIQNGSYPFTVEFYAIYNDTETKNENIEPFINWILSRQGQTLVSRTGYAPIN